MGKPSIAELLLASGYSVFTPELVQRASDVLYGNIGANLDARDWAAIMQAGNPLQASEGALRTMYQDNSYLLRNTQHLVQSGYVAAQAEITYRQMSGRLGYSYNPAWSDGTTYDQLGDLSLDQLVNMVPPPIAPTLSLLASAAGITAVVNVAGTVTASVTGSLGSFAAGNTLLSEQLSVKQGFLSLAANGQTSALTSQYITLGTAAGETLDLRGTGVRVDYVFAGAGDDEIRGGEGNDGLFGAGGNDSIFGNEDDDLLYGGDGNDAIQGGQGDDTVYGEAGDDNLEGGSTGDDLLDGGPGNDNVLGGSGADTLIGGEGNDRFFFILSADLFSGGQAVDSIDGGLGTNTLVLADPTLGVQNSFDITATDSWQRISNISRIEAAGAYGAQFNLVLNDNAYEAGLRVIDLSADTETTLNANFIDVSAESGAANRYTLTGHGGIDVITGGAGGDIISGGGGQDTLKGGSGNDEFRFSTSTQAAAAQLVDGEAGTDILTITAQVTAAIDLNANVQGVETLYLSGGSTAKVTLDASMTGATVWDSAILELNTNGQTVNATALMDGKTLTLTDTATNSATVSLAFGDLDASAYDGNLTVTAVVGTNVIKTGNGNDSITTIAGDAAIDAGAGNDTITGGIGADSLTGGTGDDRFVYDGTPDILPGENIIEGTNGGTDRLIGTAAMDFSALKVNGALDLEGAGVAEGIEEIILASGTSTFVGAQLSGNDIAINERSDGITTLLINLAQDASVDFSALTFAQVSGGNAFDDGADIIDIVAKSGVSNDNITGTRFVDKITAGGGSDTVKAGAGADTIDLTESVQAADIILLDQTTSADTVTGFDLTDTVQLSKAVYAALGATGAALDATAFVSGAGVVAGADADDRIAYNTSTGDIYYDADGNGGGAAILIATLSGAPALTESNFYVVA